LPRRCPACQTVIDDDRLVACPRCHTPLTSFPQGPTLGKEQEDRLVSAVIDSLSKGGPVLDKFVKPVGLRIVKSVHWWITFPLFWIAVLVGSHFTIKGALESLMISRIDQEFREPRIQATMQKVINDKSSEMLTKEIQPEVARFYDETTKQVQNFQVFLDNLRVEFQKEYQSLSEEVSRLKKRNDLTVLGDRAISDGDSEALDELQSLSKDSVDLTTKTAAIAEYRRVLSFWTLMVTTDSASFTVRSKDGIIKTDQQSSTSDLVSYMISSPDWQVRAVSARLLGHRTEKGVPEALLRVSRIDKHLEVRKYATASFTSITDSNVRGVFNVDGYEQWWKEHSAEVNERLADMK
jgi:hypothetical protein